MPVVDDSPTRWIRTEVQRIGVQHGPATGPSVCCFLHGHCCVTISSLVMPPRWGVIGIPVLNFMNVRQNDMQVVEGMLMARGSFAKNSNQRLKLEDWHATVFRKWFLDL